MRSYLLLLTLLIGIALTSCTKKGITYTDAMAPRIDSLLEEYNLPVKKVMILPSSGCSGCVRGAEKYLIDHLNDDSLLFILTEVHSLKMLRIRFGSDIISNENVYIDTLNHFYPYHFEEVIYPYFGNVSNGKLSRFYPF